MPEGTVDCDDLAARFTAFTLPHAEWTHAAHLTVGLWHVHRFGKTDALERLRTGIRRLNESHGTVNSDISGYHETTTRAYVELFSMFDESCPVDMSLAERVAFVTSSWLFLGVGMGSVLWLSALYVIWKADQIADSAIAPALTIP